MEPAIRYWVYRHPLQNHSGGGFAFSSEDFSMMMMILDVRYRSGHLLGNPFVKRGGDVIQEWRTGYVNEIFCVGEKKGGIHLSSLGNLVFPWPNDEIVHHIRL